MTIVLVISTVILLTQYYQILHILYKTIPETKMMELISSLKVSHKCLSRIYKLCVHKTECNTALNTWDYLLRDNKEVYALLPLLAT